MNIETSLNYFLFYFSFFSTFHFQGYYVAQWSRGPQFETQPVRAYKRSLKGAIRECFPSAVSQTWINGRIVSGRPTPQLNNQIPLPWSVLKGAVETICFLKNNLNNVFTV